MTTNELKHATVKQLREARDAMLNLEYLIGLDDLTREEQRDAALTLSNVQLAYLKLRKTKIAEIREKIDQNSDDLQQAIRSVNSALDHLSQAKVVIGAVASLVSVVARFIPLL